MNRIHTEHRELEPHQLELRFAATRVPEPRAQVRLLRSLERCGQLQPVIVVPQGDARVLLDGYRRLAALRQLGRDTLWAQLWHCPLSEALAQVLARTERRPFAPLEEALLLRELASESGASQHELARRTGRDVSWVNRRLKLLGGLDDALLGAVCQGRLSCWAAVRIFAPLARANTEHARALLATLEREPLSTRALRRWFEHYTRANRTTRERMVDAPQLFLHALEQHSHTRDAERLRRGPEGEWSEHLAHIARHLERLRHLRTQLGAAGAFEPALLNAFTRARAAFERLALELNADACAHPRPDPTGRAHPACSGVGAASDQPSARALAQHRAPPLAPSAEHER